MRVTHYNILCPTLATPTHHIRCDAADLDPETRYGRICAKLLTENFLNSVICLHEVPQ